MQIRRLEIQDYNKGIVQLLSQLTTISKKQIKQSQFNDYIETLHRNKNHNVFVIEHKKKIIATGTLLIEHKLIHNLGEVGHIEDVVIDKDYRKQGIGLYIIGYLVKVSQVNGCYKAILDCDPKNEKFYEKCEFVKKGSQMSHYF